MTNDQLTQQPMTDHEQYLRDEKVKPLLRFLEPTDRILDIGGGDGSCWNTVDKYKSIDLIDINTDIAGVYNPYQNIFTADVENDDLSTMCGKYEVVSLMGILEHLDNPVKLIKDSINAKKIVYITVPNAFSFHRIFGVTSGVTKQVDELGPQDLAIGHKRVYTMMLLADHLIEADAIDRVLEIGTTSFKFSNSKDMESFGLHRIPSLNQAAEICGISGEGKSHGAEIYCVLKGRDE